MHVAAPLTGVRAGRPVVVAAACGTAVAVLAGLVALGLTLGLDVAARELLRPGDVWGDAQWRADVVVEGAKPRNAALLLALAGVLASFLRRSWRPLLLAGYAGMLAVGLTLAVKFAVQRPDPHHEMSAVGGSFPSGHTVMVVVVLGTLVLLRRDGGRRRWHWAAVAAAALAMAVSLLLQAAHWLTDVVGGALLGAVVLATVMASRSRLRPDG